MKKSKNKRRSVALKLDIFKSYDRLEWPFLTNTLLKCDFPSKWIQLIMQYDLIVFYRVIYNGYNTPAIQPQKGLRQGDLLTIFIHFLPRCLD